MQIRVGIVGSIPGWTILLRQEGIPHASVPESPAPGEFSVLAVSGDLTPGRIDAVRNHLAAGGGVLCSGDAYAKLSPGSTTAGFTRCVLGDRNAGQFEPDLADVFVKSEIPAGANALRSDRGALTAFSGEFGGGQITVLPFDPSELVRDPRTARKSFYAARRRLPFERVSLVSKGGIRRVVSTALARLHHRCGLPYVHLWYYPGIRRTVFALRIDTDYAGRPEIEHLRDLGRRLKLPLTWFVDVGSQRSFLPVFSEFAGDEVGVHCFDHRGAGAPGKRMNDIGRAMAELASAGLNPRSYAAPYGTWNERLADDAEGFGFSYSSEFSYDYDDVPSNPYAGGRFLSTLQVPVHPVSIGSLRRQGFSEDEMISYFRSVLDRKTRLREPVIVYHHPGDGHIPVLESIITGAKDRGIEPMRMLDYALWWGGRSSEGWLISFSGSGISVSRPGSADDDTPLLHIVRPDGMETLHAAEATIEFTALDWHPQPPAPELPPDILRTRNFNPWISINRIEDSVSGLVRGFLGSKAHRTGMGGRS